MDTMSLGEILEAIVRDQGTQILQNRKQVIALYLDYAPQQKKDRELLRMFLETGGADRLLKLGSAPEARIAAELKNISRKLMEDYGLSRESADYVYREFSRGLYAEDFHAPGSEDEGDLNIPVDPLTGGNGGNRGNGGNGGTGGAPIRPGVLVTVLLLAAALAVGYWFQNREPAPGPEVRIPPVQETLGDMPAAETPSFPDVLLEPTQFTAAEEPLAETEPASFGLYADLQVGDVIPFGFYEQDNNSANGWEPIYWQVLHIEDEKALLLSVSALSAGTMHSTNAEVTWETCDLRKWLNETFYYEAFSETCRDYVVGSWIPAEANIVYPSVDPGADTFDKVFLLSTEEVSNYLIYDYEWTCSSTAYTQSLGAYVNPATGGSWWWLRTPGKQAGWFTSVNSDGMLDGEGCAPTGKNGVIRPAIWINME